jgi:hypothetical protein
LSLGGSSPYTSTDSCHSVAAVLTPVQTVVTRWQQSLHQYRQLSLGGSSSYTSTDDCHSVAAVLTPVVTAVHSTSPHITPIHLTSPHFTSHLSTSPHITPLHLTYNSDIINILIMNRITDSCMWNTCVTWQGIGYKLPEDDTIVSKHVAVW